VVRRLPMEYRVGRLGRVVAARLFEGEDLHECVVKIARQEGIRAAAVLITGGFRQAQVAVGPQQEAPKIVPDRREFLGPGEVLGVGTIYPGEQGPSLHIHTGIGKGDKAVVGCPREAKTFLVLEVTIIELDGIDGHRELDLETGVRLLRF
jgi:predicted DNA-binding protein with PD1-like motif